MITEPIKRSKTLQPLSMFFATKKNPNLTGLGFFIIQNMFHIEFGVQGF
jgi:hypothetical protein